MKLKERLPFLWAASLLFNPAIGFHSCGERSLPNARNCHPDR